MDIMNSERPQSKWLVSFCFYETATLNRNPKMQGSYLSSKMEEVDVRWFNISTWIDNIYERRLWFWKWFCRLRSNANANDSLELNPHITWLILFLLASSASGEAPPPLIRGHWIQRQGFIYCTRFLRYSDFYMHGSTSFFLCWKTTTFAIVFK